MNNILIKEFTLPPFSRIKTKNIILALKYHINNYYEQVNFFLNKTKKISWNNFCQPLFELNDNVEKIFAILDHLNSVKNNTEIRKYYEEILPLINNYNNFVTQNTQLFKSYKYLKKNFFVNKFNDIQKSSINKIILDFSLSGVSLKEKQKKRYKEITMKLSNLYLRYSNNVMDASNSWEKLVIDKKDINSLSKYFLKESSLKAKKQKKKGWLLTLDTDSYYQIMKYSDNYPLRKEIYYAYNTRASDKFINTKWDNSEIMLEILSLRKELSNLLGFKSYAHKSLKNKMLNEPKKVISFLNDLSDKILNQAKKEIKQLYKFVNIKYKVKKIDIWNISYFSEKQKDFLYKINDEKIRKYFPEQKVIKGMFNIVKRIFGVNIKERKNVEVWDDNVKFFDLFDYLGYHRGSFYLDLYIRKNKKNGAWMSVYSNMIKKSNNIQKPVANLICNFARPINHSPSLLSHKDIITLFHEFGHVLHHVLTCIDIPNISGINGVLWDAVEIPSQLMENWCWEPEVLSLISGHYKNNTPLPKKIINSMISSKNYNAGIFILKQIEFGIFDFLLHYNFQNNKTNDYILKTLYQVRKKYSLIQEPKWNRFPHTFSHIFSGGYAAGYYSYLWSHVLSSDIYSKFKKEGIFNLKTGLSFIDKFLSQGGSDHPTNLFFNFMQRKPKIEAMLKFYNIN